MPIRASRDHHDLPRPQEDAPEFQQSKRAMGRWTLLAVLGMLGVLAWFLFRGGS